VVESTLKRAPEIFFNNIPPAPVSTPVSWSCCCFRRAFTCPTFPNSAPCYVSTRSSPNGTTFLPRATFIYHPRGAPRQILPTFPPATVSATTATPICPAALRAYSFQPFCSNTLRINSSSHWVRRASMDGRAHRVCLSTMPHCQVLPRRRMSTVTTTVYARDL
jgi:hypothetical protein